MSGFIRPEVLALLRRNQPLSWTLGGVIVGFAMLWRGLATGNLLLIPAGGGLLALIVALWLAYRQRAPFLREVDAPGIVEIDEAQIRYLSPEGGGIVDRDALARVDLVSGGDGRARWALYGAQGGTPVAIPLSAHGAEALVDMLMTLPGIEVTGALAALDRRRPAIVTVWPR